MIAQVKADTGAEVMVSVWPTVEAASENYQDMFDRGLLGYSETGNCALAAQVSPTTTVYDPFNADARAYIGEKVMQNHYANGVRAFWLDADEGSGGVGESTPLPRSDSTFSAGSVDEVGLMYPYFHQQAMHDAMAAQVPSPVGPNGTGILTLSRSAWLGAAVSLFLTSHSTCPQTNATACAVRRSARCSPRAHCLAQRTHHSACAGSAARASF
jgi:alpha-D-xyloside xylohydrolase